METTVLIVEDDPNLQRTLAYNLSREGYRALTAARSRTSSCSTSCSRS